jgi:hypothetical protein
MQECETSTDKSSFVKRVTVRSGGAGHAHSGVVKGVSTDVRPADRRAMQPARAANKIVKLGG